MLTLQLPKEKLSILQKVPKFYFIFLGAALILTVGYLRLFNTGVYSFDLAQKFLPSSIYHKITPSWVEVNLVGNNLQFKFTISDQDLPAAEAFSTNLGIPDDWMKGVNLTLDQTTSDKVKAYLPLKQQLKISSQEIDFQGQNKANNGLLEPVLSEETQGFDTSDGGSFKLQNLTEGGFWLEIDQPKQVLRFALSSGKVNLSSAVVGNRLWQIMDKIAKINLEVENKDLSGKIILK